MNILLNKYFLFLFNQLKIMIKFFILIIFFNFENTYFFYKIIILNIHDFQLF